MAHIDVDVDRRGVATISVDGVKGTGCVDLTKDLERAINEQVGERTLTADAYEKPNEVRLDLKHE